MNDLVLDTTELLVCLLQPITFALVYVGTTLKDLSDVTHGWNEVSTTHWVSAVLNFFCWALAMKLLEFEQQSIVISLCWTISVNFIFMNCCCIYQIFFLCPPNGYLLNLMLNLENPKSSGSSSLNHLLGRKNDAILFALCSFSFDMQFWLLLFCRQMRA